MDIEGEHEPYVERAIELARAAGDRGDGPYGTVLVRDGEIVAEAGNRERTDDDIALHPELTLARRAAREMTPDERATTVMYTSTEPCPMCATGIVYAGLGGVVFSVSGEQAAEAVGGSSTGPSCESLFEDFEADIPVVGGVLEKEGLAVHEEFRGWSLGGTHGRGSSTTKTAPRGSLSSTYISPPKCSTSVKTTWRPP